MALVLANYPNKDGRLANGVGLDTPAGTIHTLGLLKGAGYAVSSAPETGDALMQAVLSGPTNWLTDRATRDGGEALPRATYLEQFNSLPWALKEQINTRWGAPEDDPFYTSEGFKLSANSQTLES